MRRILLSPSWLGRHLLLVAAVVAFIFLGRWQWGRGMAPTGTVQNVFYAFQWWSFAPIVTYGWWKLLRDDLRRQRGEEPEAAEPDAGELDGYRPPSAQEQLATVPAQADEGDDEELSEYNRYLAWLNDNPRR